MPPSNASAPVWLHDPASRVLTVAIVLALLYVGRDVLIPLALALMLSLLLAPLVRTARRIGIGRIPSVLIAVLALTISCATIAVVLGTQILHIAASLPQYEVNVQHKLKALDEATVGRLRLLTTEASRIIEIHDTADAIPSPAGEGDRVEPAPPWRTVVLEPREAAPPRLQLIGKLLTSAWIPIQAAGIVMLVLVFVLLEHESLRDRFIRLAGATDIRATTVALNDAGERLSRFFVSQFVVNLCFGVAIGLSLSALRVPQAILCGSLACVMRFVPYVGVGIAALFATVLASAVDAGWTLAAGTVATFILLDSLAAQLLEPHLYGHATGLSPLSVVVAAIFWSWLWGPVGLVLSTPLTLCLVVAGRHVKALGSLELLLSDSQALTLAQKFYQRALSGDPQEIIADAQAFLKRDPLAAYCDRVLIPALHLARIDADARTTSDRQHQNIHRVTIDVVAALCNTPKRARRRYRGSLLEDVSAGRWLRQQREEVRGRWQGPLGAPPGSVVICLGLDACADDLAAELLTRLLLAEKIDARHFSPADLRSGLPPGAHPQGVSLFYLVSAFPGSAREQVDSISTQAHALFPYARVIRVFCPGVTAPTERLESPRGTDEMASSLVQAIDICTACQAARNGQCLPPGSQPAGVLRAGS